MPCFLTGIFAVKTNRGRAGKNERDSDKRVPLAKINTNVTDLPTSLTNDVTHPLARFRRLRLEEADAEEWSSGSSHSPLERSSEEIASAAGYACFRRAPG